jgi:hypothetical protein
MEEFWFDNYKVLYENGNYISFFPRANTTRTEQFNSIARFAIYLLILIILFGDPKNTTWLYLPFFLLFLTIFLHKFENTNIMPTNNQDNGDYVEIDPSKRELINQPKVNKYNPTSSLSNKVCRRPTENNPLMNILLSDFKDDPSVGPACDNDDTDIQNEVKDTFNKSLYRDVNDLYERENSQRTYYSAPSTTIPNDQKAFAEWCYGVPETCKTNQQKCLRYDDPSLSRNVSPYEYVL